MIIAARNLHRHIYGIASSLKNGSWNDSLQSQLNGLIAHCCGCVVA